MDFKTDATKILYASFQLAHGLDLWKLTICSVLLFPLFAGC